MRNSLQNVSRDFFIMPSKMVSCFHEAHHQIPNQLHIELIQCNERTLSLPRFDCTCRSVDNLGSQSMLDRYSSYESISSFRRLRILAVSTHLNFFIICPSCLRRIKPRQLSQFVHIDSLRKDAVLPPSWQFGSSGFGSGSYHTHMLNTVSSCTVRVSVLTT